MLALEVDVRNEHEVVLWQVMAMVGGGLLWMKPMEQFQQSSFINPKELFEP